MSPTGSWERAELRDEIGRGSETVVALPDAFGVFGVRKLREPVARVQAHTPPLVVDRVVVEEAEQDAVAQVGGATGGPAEQVMRVAPLGRPVAAGKSASVIPLGQDPALLLGEESLGRPLIQRD